jgi:outer membrane protein assembly factor BamB
MPQSVSLATLLRSIGVVLTAVGCRDALGGGSDGVASRVAWVVAEVRAPTRAGYIAVDSQAVYVYRNGLSISAVRLSDHTLMWTAIADENVDNGAALRGIARCQGNVVFGSYLAVYGVAPENGRRRWKWAPSLGGAVGFGAPVCEGGTLYFGTGYPALLYAVDAATGQEKWVARLSRIAGVDGFVATPSVSDGVVVACTREFTTPVRGMIAGVDAATGQVRWEYTWMPLPSRPDGSCAVNVASLNGVAVGAADDGRIFGLDAQTGTVRWIAPVVEGFGTPRDERPVWIVDGVVMAGSLSGVVTAFDLQTGVERWKKAAAPSTATTFIAPFTGDRGQFIAATLSGSANAYEALTGRELWTVKYGGSVNERRLFGPGALTPELFIVIGSDGLYAIRR